MLAKHCRYPSVWYLVPYKNPVLHDLAFKLIEQCMGSRHWANGHVVAYELKINLCVSVAKSVVLLVFTWCLMSLMQLVDSIRKLIHW